MTGAEALNLVMFRLGNRTDTTTRSIALSEMRLLQQSLEGGPTLPWFLFQFYVGTGSPYYSLTAGSGRLNTPTGFLNLDEDADVIFLFDPDTGLNTNLANLVAKLPRDELTNVDMNLDNPEGPAVPSVYAMNDRTIRVRPVPDKSYIVQLPCYIADTLVDDSGVENLWLQHASDLMVAGTVEIMAKGLRDWELLAAAREDTAAARRRLMIQNEMQTHTARRYIMGGPS